ncbi:MAG: MBL fold metallo-hydrolase [Syntrophorhabdaceae bacterium]|nr:MBL fold metallo-hydrolase [Syntrophorhabdaceae bacterium]
MITKLTDQIWIVHGLNNGRYPYSHSLYIKDSGILVDAGADPDEIDRLREGEGIETVMMTHYHEDHFTYLSRVPDAQVWASEADAPAFGSLETLLAYESAAGTEWEAPYRKLLTEKFHFTPRKIARGITDGEELLFGKTRAVAVVSPGHSQGHLCLHFPDEEILFMADYDLTEFGPWYGDARCGIEDLRRSVRRLAKIDARICVTSHEGPTYQGSIAEKAEAYLATISGREQALREFLRKPRTRAEIISRRLFCGQGNDWWWLDYAEWSLFLKHMDEMMLRGEASFEDGRYRLLP